MRIVAAGSPPRLGSHGCLVPFRDAHVVCLTDRGSIVGVLCSNHLSLTHRFPIRGITVAEYCIPSQTAYHWSVLEFTEEPQFAKMEFKPRLNIECGMMDHLRLPVHAILMHDPFRPFSLRCATRMEYQSPLCADQGVSSFHIAFFPGGLPVPELRGSPAL